MHLLRVMELASDDLLLDRGPHDVVCYSSNGSVTSLLMMLIGCFGSFISTHPHPIKIRHMLKSKSIIDFSAAIIISMMTLKKRTPLLLT